MTVGGAAAAPLQLAGSLLPAVTAVRNYHGTLRVAHGTELQPVSHWAQPRVLLRFPPPASSPVAGILGRIKATSNIVRT